MYKKSVIQFILYTASIIPH